MKRGWGGSLERIAARSGEDADQAAFASRCAGEKNWAWPCPPAIKTDISRPDPMTLRLLSVPWMFLLPKIL
jgi:hypothetical protein